MTRLSSILARDERPGRAPADAGHRVAGAVGALVDGRALDAEDAVHLVGELAARGRRRGRGELVAARQEPADRPGARRVARRTRRPVAVVVGDAVVVARALEGREALAAAAADRSRHRRHTPALVVLEVEA